MEENNTVAVEAVAEPAANTETSQPVAENTVTGVDQVETEPDYSGRQLDDIERDFLKGTGVELPQNQPNNGGSAAQTGAQRADDVTGDTNHTVNETAVNGAANALQGGVNGVGVPNATAGNSGVLNNGNVGNNPGGVPQNLGVNNLQNPAAGNQQNAPTGVNTAPVGNVSVQGNANSQGNGNVAESSGNATQGVQNTAKQGSGNANLPGGAHVHGTEEWAELAREHPEVIGNKLPEEVFKAIIASDKTALQVYESVMLKQSQNQVAMLQAQVAKLQQDLDNSKRAPVLPVANTAPSVEPKDPILEAFNKFLDQ